MKKITLFLLLFTFFSSFSQKAKILTAGSPNPFGGPIIENDSTIYWDSYGQSDELFIIFDKPDSYSTDYELYDSLSPTKIGFQVNCMNPKGVYSIFGSNNEKVATIHHNATDGTADIEINIDGKKIKDDTIFICDVFSTENMTFNLATYHGPVKLSKSEFNYELDVFIGNDPIPVEYPFFDENPYYFDFNNGLPYTDGDEVFFKFSSITIPNSCFTQPTEYTSRTFVLKNKSNEAVAIDPLVLGLLSQCPEDTTKLINFNTSKAHKWYDGYSHKSLPTGDTLYLTYEKLLQQPGTSNTYFIAEVDSMEICPATSPIITVSERLNCTSTVNLRLREMVNGVYKYPSNVEVNIDRNFTEGVFKSDSNGYIKIEGILSSGFTAHVVDSNYASECHGYPRPASSFPFQYDTILDLIPSNGLPKIFTGLNTVYSDYLQPQLICGKTFSIDPCGYYDPFENWHPLDFLLEFDKEDNYKSNYPGFRSFPQTFYPKTYILDPKKGADSTYYVWNENDSIVAIIEIGGTQNEVDSLEFYTDNEAVIGNTYNICEVFPRKHPRYNHFVEGQLAGGVFKANIQIYVNDTLVANPKLENYKFVFDTLTLNEGDEIYIATSNLETTFSCYSRAKKLLKSRVLTVHIIGDNLSLPLASVSNPTFCEGDTIILSSSSSDGRWYKNFNDLSIFSSSSTTNVTEEGSYIYVVTNPVSVCPIVSNVIKVKDNCLVTSLIETENKEVKLYPNPTEDFLFLDAEIDGTITLFNQFGDLMHRQFTADVINISHLSSGMYFYELSTSSGIYSGKIIKK